MSNSVIHAELLIRTYALSNYYDKTYRAWVYDEKYATSSAAYKFIHDGLKAGLLPQQIFDLSITTYSQPIEELREREYT